MFTFDITGLRIKEAVLGVFDFLIKTPKSVLNVFLIQHSKNLE
jgi:hypothetical protein